MLHVKRINVSTRCTPPTVFQTKTSHIRINVSYRHIEDMIDVSTNLNLDDRIDYFAANGVDFINVIRYFDYLKNLEKLVQKKVHK